MQRREFQAQYGHGTPHPRRVGGRPGAMAVAARQVRALSSMRVGEDVPRSGHDGGHRGLRSVVQEASPADAMQILQPHVVARSAAGTGRLIDLANVDQAVGDPARPCTETESSAKARA